MTVYCLQFLPKSYIDFGFTLRSFICNEIIIFLHDFREYFNLLDLHVSVQFSEQYLLKWPSSLFILGFFVIG